GRCSVHLLDSGIGVLSLELLHHIAAHPVRVVLHHGGAAAAAPTRRLARPATALKRGSQDREPGRRARALEKQPSSRQPSLHAGRAFLAFILHSTPPPTAPTPTSGRHIALPRTLAWLARPSTPLAP